jgi:hypothetical protein
MKKQKRYIPKGYAVRIFMWKNENFDVRSWEEYKLDESAMKTAATSINAAMQIVKEGLERGYTHFTLKYPIANYGGMVKEPENGK